MDAAGIARMLPEVFERAIPSSSLLRGLVEAIAELLRRPDTVIADVAWAVRRHVDEKAFDAVLGTLGEEARRFWAV